MSTVGERLREARKKAGLSAGELGRRAAAALGREKPISESAIRNQENGTNGVPYEALNVYSDILECPRGWLAFGEGEHIPRGKMVRRIVLMPPISAEWSSADIRIEPGKSPFVQVHVPEFADARLHASEVSAPLNVPEYPLGTLLIYGWLDSVGARSGDHVVVYKVDEEEDLKHSLRVVRSRDGKVYFEPLPGAGPDEEPIEYGTHGYVPAAVVVATYRLLPAKVGPLLVSQSGLPTENLLTTERQEI